ncbi:MAG: FAD-binding oxidoreductase [Phycisphaerae bacterium]
MHETAAQRPPHEPLVALGTTDCRVTDMTVVASADVTLADLQAELTAHRQWLPVDGDPSLTLGELVLANSTGPLRLGFGGWRDLLLGVQFHNGRGELITAGGQVVKNVAGYDLTKLLVGSHGLFGRPVTLSSRTYRRPAGAVHASLPPDPAALLPLLTTDRRPQWSLLTPEALTLGYLGDEATLAFYERELAEANPRRVTVEEDITLRAEAFGRVAGGGDAGGDTGRMVVAVPPAAVGRFVSAAGTSRWSADPAFGIVVVRDAAGQAVKRAAAEAGGAVLPRDAAEAAEAFGQEPAKHALLRRLIDAFNSPRP